MESARVDNAKDHTCRRSVCDGLEGKDGRPVVVMLVGPFIVFHSSRFPNVSSLRKPAAQTCPLFFPPFRSISKPNPFDPLPLPLPLPPLFFKLNGSDNGSERNDARNRSISIFEGDLPILLTTLS